MKVLVVVTLLVVGAYSKVISPPEAIISPEETTAYNYHEKVGIPEAERIRVAEEQIHHDPGRIAGGVASFLGQNPWLGGMVISLTNNATSVCGSALLSNTRLVTAAHCWWDGWYQAREFQVVLGSVWLFSGGTRLNTTNCTVHPNWNHFNYINDIAIVIIPFVAYNNAISPLALPTGNYANSTFAGQWGRLAGFGATTSNGSITTNQTQHHVDVEILTNPVCQQTYGANYIVNSTMCTSGASGRGACPGDSGGPLVLNIIGTPTLIGVISFGSAHGCQAGYPLVHSRTTSHTSWIRANL